MGEEYFRSDSLTRNPLDWSSTEVYRFPVGPLPSSMVPQIRSEQAITKATQNFGKMRKIAKQLDYLHAQKTTPSDIVPQIQNKKDALTTATQNFGKMRDIAASLPKPTKELTNWGKFKQGANKVMNSKAANYAMQGINIALGFMRDNDKDINSRDAAAKQIREMGENFLISSGNPFLITLGFGSKGLGKLGAYGDASSGLGLANDIANTLGAYIPGVGWIAKKTKELQKYQDVMASTGYTGVINDLNKAAQNAGGRFLGGVEKQDALTDNVNLVQQRAHEALGDNKLALQNSSNPSYQLKTQVLTSGGYNAMSGKNGAKLYNLQEAKRILSNRLQSFKNGGAVNVIPDGALHKNRHHLEDIDEKFEDVTTKGIPVITEAKNGDIIQQAEVEKEEIIFNLEVTKKLEELMEKDTDEAAIEAGKLLTDEILRNTIDNTKKLL